MFDPGQLNWIAVLVAALSGMVLGAVWYSPLAFGNAWLKALGKSEDELASPLVAMAGSAIACLVSAVSMALLIYVSGLAGWTGGALIGLTAGIGIVAMTMLSDSLFSGWGWPLYLIQAGYRVLYLIVMGVIIGAWPQG